MTFDIQPSPLFTYVILGVAAVVLVSMFLKQGEWKRKIISVAIAAVVLETDERTCLVAPEDIDALIAAVSEHVAVTQSGE